MTREEYHEQHQDEANRVRALRKQEDKIRQIEQDRFQRRLSALCPGTAIEDGEFPGCTWDAAPYPYLGDAA